MIKQIKNGVYPTMVTPFTKDNKIDYNAVEQLLEWYDSKGVDGIFAICQSSEIFFLSFEEKLELLKFIIKNTGSDMNIVASGHTDDDIQTQILHANAYIEQGIDAYVFISNRFAKENESDEVFLKNMHTVLAGIPDDIGLGIYECPYPYKRLMNPTLLKEVANTGRFSFLKDTCCDLDVIKAKLEAVEGTGLKIYNANAATLLDSLKMGCSGYSGVMANFHPELYSEICRCFNGDARRAQTIQNFVGCASMTECQLYPVNAKYYLSLDGVDMGFETRSKDISEFTRAKQMEIEQLHESTQLFKKYINI